MDGIRKLLVANRGEIACRVMRTARRLGVPTVALYSDVDRKAKHVTYADEAFHIGGAAAKDSYLRRDRIIDIALRTGVTHIHPGYGFLSENTEFAKDCETNDIKFVGPPASAIRAMGDKIESKVIMERAGVPLVPGYHGSDQSLGTLVSECKKIGFPVLVKAALGGGGKGMKVAHSADECETAIQSAQREALSSFGDQRVLLEKYVGQPRHIEVQVLADSHGNVLHFYERDCSVQRRHQKIIEEAPAFGITDAFRAALHRAAVDASRAVGYENAGTVEFLVDASTWDFYFMEMNTRLQVEHPVTESVTGVDLVELQLMVAAGERLPLAQDQVKCEGHAVEVRLYAENPEKDFMPATGDLSRFRCPEGTREFELTEGVRVDSGVREGDSVTDYYDPMIAKMVTRAGDRASAIKEMERALGNLQIDLQSNVEFLKRIVAQESFLSGDFDTNFIPQHEADLFPEASKLLSERSQWLALAAALRCKLDSDRSPLESSWAASDGFRAPGTVLSRDLVTRVGDDERALEVAYLPGGSNFEVEGHRVRISRLSGESCHVEVDGVLHAADYVCVGDAVHLWLSGAHFVASFPCSDAKSSRDEEGGGNCVSPMPGRVVSIFVENGQTIQNGEITHPPSIVITFIFFFPISPCTDSHFFRSIFFLQGRPYWLWRP